MAEASCGSLRILHVITRLVQGGAQINTVLTAARQVADGHEVWIAYGPDEGPEGTVVPEATAAGARLEQVDALVRPVRWGRDWIAGRRLRRLIRRIEPQVVHTHSSKAGIVGRAAAWREKVPLVVHTVHGLPFHRGNGWSRNRLYVAAERWAARRCHAIVAITGAMEHAMLRRRIGRPEQFTVIPSGVDPQPFEAAFAARGAHRARVRASLGIDPEVPVIGMVARLDPLKGQDDLLDCLPLLRRRWPSLRVLLVGDGRHRARIERRLRYSDLGACVHLAGRVPVASVPGWYPAMDLQVLPSYQEGQGRTLVEGMLLGVPAVGYDAGGIPEVCLHGETGLVVPTGEGRRLRGALLDLLADPECRVRMGARGRAVALERFTARRMTDQLAELYARRL